MGEQMLNAFKCPHDFVRYYNDCKYQNRDECLKCKCGQYIAAEKIYLAILLEKYGLDCLWISVKDRLPEEKINPVTKDFQQVICFCDFGGDPRITDVRTFGYGTPMGHKEAHFWYGPGIMDGVVTHWMPLPEPPKERT